MTIIHIVSLMKLLRFISEICDVTTPLLPDEDFFYIFWLQITILLYLPYAWNFYVKDPMTEMYVTQFVLR